MTKKRQKISVADEIMKVINEQPKLAEDIRKELKDNFGRNIPLSDIRVNLLYLLRRQKIKRKKEDSVYKYYI